MLYFCLDIGGTSTRGALMTAQGNVLARAKSTGGALSLGIERSASAIRTVWQDILLQIDHAIIANEEIHLAAGIAGKGLPGRAEALGKELSEFISPLFVGDGYGALLAATNGKPGTLISIGTGVTGQNLDENGINLALSGWGFPAGDQGGGAWLGLQLAHKLTKYLDGIALTPPPDAEFMAKVMLITGQTVASIMAWHTTATPAGFGALAPLIVDAANDSDAFCGALLEAAALEIVNLSKSLHTQTETPIYLSGGLGAILHAYCKRNAPEFDWQVTSSDPIMGLFLLATGQAPAEKLALRPRLKASL